MYCETDMKYSFYDQLMLKSDYWRVSVMRGIKILNVSSHAVVSSQLLSPASRCLQLVVVSSQSLSPASRRLQPVVVSSQSSSPASLLSPAICLQQVVVSSQSSPAIRLQPRSSSSATSQSSPACCLQPFIFSKSSSPAYGLQPVISSLLSPAIRLQQVVVSSFSQ